MIENQSQLRENIGRVGDASKPTYHVPSPESKVPVFITIKWLALTKECFMPRCRKVNYARLHRLVLTDEVLEYIGKSREDLHGLSEFDLVTSNKLKKILSL